MSKEYLNNGPMLNLYPDSIGSNLGALTELLERPLFEDTIASVYILPSLFDTDLDRGFSVISYDLNEQLACPRDLAELERIGIDLKLDFILNHASVLSEQFQDLLKYGEQSRYRDFFIDWNKFWQGHGQMTAEGYIQPDEEMIRKMFFRKPGLPFLMVRFPDGKNVPYWNTFYQEVRYPVPDAQDIMKAAGVRYYDAEKIAALVNRSISTGSKPQEIDFGNYERCKASVVEYLESNRKYLGQMDLNIRSELVWDFYASVLERLAGYGAKIVRLDAFAYAPKEPGEKNFLNQPGTWQVLERVQQLADRHDLELLPEIHASYGEKTYREIASRGYMVYDFFLPGLLIDALENGDGRTLKAWADEVLAAGIRTVNMLGCHDGIPLLDLKGLIPEERIRQLIDTVVARGGLVKDLHGQQNVYYQVNATYYSALGADDRKMLLARAIQLFMPGKPQIWYLDLLAGENDHQAAAAGGPGGHKEINRTNLSMEQIEAALKKEVVIRQLEMLRFRNTHPAFAFDAKITVESQGSRMNFKWEKEGYSAELKADLAELSYVMTGSGRDEDILIFS